MCCPENDRVEGEIIGYRNGPDGELAVAEADVYDFVGIPLALGVWSGAGSPKLGDTVLISGLTEHNGTWQALSARLAVPGEQPDIFAHH